MSTSRCLVRPAPAWRTRSVPIRLAVRPRPGTRRDRVVRSSTADPGGRAVSRDWDFIVQTDLHDDDCNYLKYVFKSQLVNVPRSRVVSDCRVDWNLPGVRPLGPDVAVFFDIDRRGDVATLDVAAEGATPALVVEVTSPSTRENDVEHKFDFTIALECRFM